VQAFDSSQVKDSASKYDRREKGNPHMSKSICIINGHPDPSPGRLNYALCEAAEIGAREGGHTVSRIDVGALEFPLLSSAEEFEHLPPEQICKEREKISTADHLIISFPLWLGGMPAKLRGFFEQTARASFFIDQSLPNGWPLKLMKGKSARIFVTMGMPGAAYSLLMDQAVLKELERGMLGVSGIKPIRHDVFGGVGEVPDPKYERWISKARGRGKKAN
jgi:putative NADPH-quinone reductase